MRWVHHLALGWILAMGFVPAMAQSGSGSPRFQTQYRQVYTDNLETPVPTPANGFVLGTAGSFTSNPAEVVAGARSYKGSYFGPGSYTPYLTSDPAAMPFTPSRTYRVTFQYKILAVADKGFEALFYSPAGGASNHFLPSVTLTGAVGATGSATLTSTLGPYPDYSVRWNIVGQGAVAIDEIRITDVGTGTVLATESAERLAPGPGPGLRLLFGATLSTDALRVVSGTTSIHLTGSGLVETVPSVVNLTGNTTYIVEFRYRILSRGSEAALLSARFQPVGTTDSNLMVTLHGPLKNAETEGTYSMGAQTAGAASWVLQISPTAGASIAIDDLRIMRQDAEMSAAPPAGWSVLDRTPFPRLGRYMFAPPHQLVRYPLDGTPSFARTQSDLERSVAFADVIAGIEPDVQTQYPEFVRTIRQLNPSAVILPYRLSMEQAVGWPPPFFSNVSLTYSQQQSFPDAYFVRDSKGNYVREASYPNIGIANVSPFGPVVNGNAYSGWMLDWLDTQIFRSGLWDGVFFDNLFGRASHHLPNHGDPSRFDVDWNRNGLRDETLAATHEMSRKAAIGLMEDFHRRTGGHKLVVGNTGSIPDTVMAPYVNGYLIECAEQAWDGWAEVQSSSKWRGALDAYQAMDAAARRPVLNIYQACGENPPFSPVSSGGQIGNTAGDIHRHRFALGTALLGNAFYFYSIAGSLGMPEWYDEYSVDKTGTAVQDRAGKGYLGQPLTVATESTDPGTLVFSEDFDGPSLPASFSGVSGPVTVEVSGKQEEVISGAGSLVISNSDHGTLFYSSASTVPGAVPLTPLETYRVTFEWRVLETLDGFPWVDFGDSRGRPAYTVQGVVAGDSGTATFPITLPDTPSSPFMRFTFLGGGKIAIDNIRVYRGGVGPWRRDFQNGFVLVNPLPQPRIFSAADLAGPLGRTGIRRIKGTQAPDVNNGQPVTGDLTLAPFDAIILLADSNPGTASLN